MAVIWISSPANYRMSPSLPGAEGSTLHGALGTSLFRLVPSAALSQPKPEDLAQSTQRSRSKENPKSEHRNPKQTMRQQIPKHQNNPNVEECSFRIFLLLVI